MLYSCTHHHHQNLIQPGTMAQLETKAAMWLCRVWDTTSGIFSVPFRSLFISYNKSGTLCCVFSAWISLDIINDAKWKLDTVFVVSRVLTRSVPAAQWQTVSWLTKEPQMSFISFVTNNDLQATVCLQMVCLSLNIKDCHVWSSTPVWVLCFVLFLLTKETDMPYYQPLLSDSRLPVS